MFLKELTLYNFKNYESAQLALHPTINCFVGNNGSGKTNLLDAIYYLSLTKSAFNPVDLQNIRYEQPHFVIEGSFELPTGVQKVMCAVQIGERKVVKVNQQAYEKIAQHIGKYPCVLMSPNDTDLVREGSEVRRKFFDGLLAQISQTYLEDLLIYNQLLKRRNTLLKQFYERRFFDKPLLESYDEPLVEKGIAIYKEREKQLTAYIPLFEQAYQQLTQHQEEVSLSYQTQWQRAEDYPVQFKEALPKDSVLQRTTVGIHKDDFLFKIHQKSLKKFASQGQQKSFVIALKLAKFEMLCQHKPVIPILLMDDIFDKLDQSRILQLLKIVTRRKLGQLFITDTNPERMEQLMKALSLRARIFHIQQGGIERTYEV